MFYGKNIFSWNVPEYMNGNPEKFAQGLADADFEGVMLKCADGHLIQRPASYSPWPSWGPNIKPSLVTALKSAGFKVYLWHYLYGDDPSGEKAQAKSQIEKFEPDGYIWNAEGSFDAKANAESNARLLTEGIKEAFPDLPQALCWWALPKNPNDHNIEWHPIRVAKAFLEVADVGMPMMYWQGSTPMHAYEYLIKSLTLWRLYVTKDKPILPIGRAYTGDGGIVNPPAITEFANRVYNMGDTHNLVGVSWWSLDNAYDNAPVWEALSMTPKYGKETGKLSTAEILERLMNGHPELFPELY